MFGSSREILVEILARIYFRLLVIVGVGALTTSPDLMLSDKTTFAPIDTSSPTQIGPTITAPAPISTRSPMVGQPHDSFPLTPMVTPWRIRTSFPMMASSFTTIPTPCSILNPGPTCAPARSSIPKPHSTTPRYNETISRRKLGLLTLLCCAA